MFHPLENYRGELPTLFTNPFDYQPHPVVEFARQRLCDYLSEQRQWHEEIDQGKMFGILVVEDAQGNLGFLAAFSGYLAKRNHHSYFVPPILDLQDPVGFFKLEEANISNINSRIAQIDGSREAAQAAERVEQLKAEESSEMEQLKAQYALSRSRRRALRQEGCSAEQLEALNLESQHQRGIMRRRELHYTTLRKPLESLLESYSSERNRLLEERSRRSAALQKLTFSEFKPLNGSGVTKDLLSIFEEYNHTIPPAGSGECAAPKLLHYSFENSLRAVAMGEFWWGSSTRGEVRHHLHYYTACRGKCHPILTHMLQGIEVEPPRQPTREEELRQGLTIIYEDEFMVAFNKPSGLPSVRGLNHTLSVQSIAEELYPTVNPNNLIVHRLDMDTSGILIVAKSAEVQRNIQQQFAQHTIRKRYVALLDGVLEQPSGAITLPLITDPLDRPRQRVDFNIGKSAYTHYTTLSVSDGKTRVALYPQTGRTHQLRVHCAHPQGLNTPIVGDRLYGRAADRLLLHAEHIMMLHPSSGRKFSLRALAGF